MRSSLVSGRTKQRVVHLPYAGKWLLPLAAASVSAGCAGTTHLTDWIGWLGRLHAQAVHFPIALLVAAGAAELLLVLTRKAWFADAGRFCLWGGTLGATVAAPLGWLNAGWHLGFDPAVTGLAQHRWLGTAVFGWAVVLLVLSEVVRTRSDSSWVLAYRVALLGAVVLVTVTAYYGGLIVYGPGYFSPPT